MIEEKPDNVLGAYSNKNLYAANHSAIFSREPVIKTREKICEIAYQKYQLDWMIRHGYGLLDIAKVTESKEKDDDSTWYENFIERGFNGEIFACYEEFFLSEYRDVLYMEQLLTKEEMVQYRNDIQE